MERCKLSEVFDGFVKNTLGFLSDSIIWKFSDQRSVRNADEKIRNRSERVSSKENRSKRERSNETILKSIIFNRNFTFLM